MVEQTSADSMVHLDEETFVNWLNDKSPQQLERIVAGIVAFEPYHASVTEYAGDGGVDVAIYRADEATGRGQPACAIQVKHPSNPVSVHVVREIVGVAAGRGFSEAWVVTTSSFTGPARDFCDQVNADASSGVTGEGADVTVELLDAADLYEWLEVTENWWVLDAHSAYDESLAEHRPRTQSAHDW